MSQLDLTPEQQEAVYYTGGRFSVRAAAGAGKTRVIVARYLRLIQELRLRADQILTITYTRKAAAEMKERITRSLTEAGLREEAQLAETGPIQTIHSFCERVLRENALEAGIDPQFEVASPESMKGLFHAAFTWGVEHAVEEYEESAQLVAKLAGKAVGRGAGTLQAAIHRPVEAIVDKLRSSGLVRAEIEPKYMSVETLAAAMKPLILDSVPPELREAMDLDHRPLWEQLGTFSPRDRNVPEALRKLVGPHEHLESLIDSIGLMKMSLEVWTCLNRLVDEQQQFGFPELETRAVRLLEDSAATRERLQRQYLAILVDESQDLNPMQYRLIGRLGIENEMMVGDPQQSIYAFRESDFQLFLDRSSSMKSLSLNKNWRTDMSLLRFVDRLFGEVWKEDYWSMADSPNGGYDGVEFWPLTELDTATTVDLLEQMRQERGFGYGDIAVLVRQTKTGVRIAEQMASRGIPHQLLGGTEKFYANMEIRDLANVLTAMAEPLNDYVLASVLRSPAVNLSLDSIVMLASHRDGKSMWEQLPDFEPEVEQDRDVIDEFLEWFLPLSRVADRMPAWEVLSELFRTSPYLCRVAQRQNSSQTLANIRKLLQIAASEPSLNAIQFAERIREVQELGHKEGDASAVDQSQDAVSILTVHKAKGLEWNAVILPDLFRKFTFQNSDPQMFDSKSALLATKFNAGTDKNGFLSTLKTIHAKKEAEEAWRVLYVAMTRARKCLCLSVQANSPSNSIAKRIWEMLKFQSGIDESITTRLVVRSPGD